MPLVPTLRNKLFEEYDRHNGPPQIKEERGTQAYISEDDLSNNKPHYSVEDLAEIDVGFEDLKKGRKPDAFGALEKTDLAMEYKVNLW